MGALSLAASMTWSAPVLAMAPGPPAEAPAGAPAASEPESEADIEQVRQLYEDGKAKFDTYDYDGAIELWTRAYGELDPTEENREIRNNLVYNIATAQEKAFDLDTDITHLRQAKGLLERYLTEYKSLYRPTPEGRAEVAKVQARIREIDTRIAEAEGGPTTATAPVPAAPPHDPGYETAKLREQKVRELLRTDPEISRQYKSGRGMVIGGSVSLGVGGLMGLGALAYGPDAGSKSGRAAAIGVGSVGMALMVTGAVLLGLGIPKRKAAKEKAREKAASMTADGPTARVMITPTLGGGAFGLHVAGRF